MMNYFIRGFRDKRFCWFGQIYLTLDQSRNISQPFVCVRVRLMEVYEANNIWIIDLFYDVWNVKITFEKNHHKKNILIKILENCIVFKNLNVIRHPVAMGDNDCFVNFCSPYNPGTGLTLFVFLPFWKEKSHENSIERYVILYLGKSSVLVNNLVNMPWKVNVGYSTSRALWYLLTAPHWNKISTSQITLFLPLW